jgi:signal transduction histidine kinase
LLHWGEKVETTNSGLRNKGPRPRTVSTRQGGASPPGLQALKAAERRAELLSEASRFLAGSLDMETALLGLVNLAIPELADWCAIDLVDGDGSLKRLVLAYADPKFEGAARLLQEKYPPRADEAFGVAEVIRSGLSEWVARYTDELLKARCRGSEHEEILRTLGLSASITVALRARGKNLGALTFCDSTRRRRFREADLRLAEDLAHRTALCLENARLYHELQEAVRLRDDFLSIASHELKTPLTPLQLKLQFLQKSLSAASEHTSMDLARMLDSTQDHVRRLSQLVNNLLDVSRLSAGKLDLTPEPLELGSLVREVVERFEPQATRTFTRLELDLSPVPGHWDRLRLEQVVTNLLTNALKYGEGTAVRVSVSEEGDLARLTVQDQGIGIALEAQTRIFGRFERAVTGHHYSGLGLGLFIVQQIVEGMGGTIRVDSAPGKGATFTVELSRGPLS